MIQSRTLPALAGALGALLLGSAPALADGWCHLTPWTLDGSEMTLFGSDVQLENGWAFVSSTGGQAVQVYRRQGATYVPTQLLTSPDGPESGDRFGKVIELDGDRLFVSATWADGAQVDQGRVHVFERSGSQWLAAGVIEAPAPAFQDRFGAALSADGDWLAVSTLEQAPTYDSRAFIYRHVDGNWQFDQLVSGLDTGIYNVELALRARPGGQTADLFVGQPGATSPQLESSAGAVRHFLLTSIGPFVGPTIQPGSLDAGDLFGCALDFDGDQLFVGAQNVDGIGFQDGAVHIYDVDTAPFLPTVQLAQVLSAPAHATNSKFGDALDVQGARLAVGARFAHVGEIAMPGLVHTFVRNDQGTWIVEETLLPTDVGDAGALGASVAVEGEHVLAGAYSTGTGPGLNPGAAFLFSLTSTTLAGGNAPADVLATAEIYWPSGGPTAGPSLAIDSPPVPGESSTLTVEGGEPFGVPFLFWGLAPTEVPFLGETLLVDLFYAQKLPILGANGSSSVSVGVPNDPSLHGAMLFLQAGVLHLFPQSGDGVEATNGLRLTVGY
ncbi:hypothetical protein [Engelhardtia mirabilis]|uniref:Uncharacterized protein n=1 Tax=Engelhardtia mirabilis TaxID=2528011 RepID=A0A518BGR2_9BACT|nr:hypothetical protein Pla133_12450 [Planctomycetes bacterium Pla133]QDV00506.1 hypothetical protein Pla86_12450 [Planctomycetes bacterium Pla86]